MRPPCGVTCPNRHAECHATCPKWAEWEAFKAARQAERDLEYAGRVVPSPKSQHYFDRSVKKR